MAALSTGTYGKGSAVTSVDLADRITAALENAHGAIGALNVAASTGAPVDQAAVNTLLKVVQDLGELATDARKAAADEAAEVAAGKADAAAHPASSTGSSPASGSTSGSGTSGGAGSGTSKS